jgi:hypothetical protein
LVCAVLLSLINVYEIVDKINSYLNPEHMKMVIFEGSIEKGLAGRNVKLMSGRAIQQSQVIMKFLKNEKTLFRMITENTVMDNLITNNINFLLLIKNKRKPKNLEIIADYEKGYTQREVAKHFGMCQRGISENLKSSHWSEVTIAEQRLNKAIKHYYGNRIVL